MKNGKMQKVKGAILKDWKRSAVCLNQAHENDMRRTNQY